MKKQGSEETVTTINGVKEQEITLSTKEEEEDEGVEDEVNRKKLKIIRKQMLDGLLSVQKD